MSDPLRFLLLEDNPLDAELILAELRRAAIACEARRVWTERAFVEALQDPGVDLVLADYSLPAFDGLMALELTRRLRPGLPFLIVSGSLGEELAVHAIHQGATDYLTKQGLARLGPAVRRALREVAEQQERQRTEQALRDSERRFLEVTTHVGGWVWEIDADGLYTYSSPAGERLHGRPSPEVVGRLRFHDFFPEGLRDDLLSIAFERFAGQQSFVGFQYPCVHKDGHVLLLETNGTPVLDPEGRLLGYQGVAMDVTEREHFQAQILAQARLLDLATDAIVVQDLDDRLRYCNRSALQLFGWRADDVLGRQVAELCWRDAEPFARAKAQVLAAGQWTGEMKHRTRNGTEVICNSRWTLVRDARGAAESILVIDTDITERKRLQAQFLRAQRLESVGQLAGGIAHDLNNILAPIMMSTPMLRECISDPDALGILDTIEASARRGADIVRQILVFSRGSKTETTRVRTRLLFDEIAAIFRETFPRSITLKVVVAGGLPAVEGDASQLHQVLMNLGVNARDAMPEGGDLTLTAGTLAWEAIDSPQKVDARPGPFVVWRVKDTGAGIPAENLERIFDPFFTTKEPGKGTGLGLFTVLGIVRNHGGWIDVSSESGKGTEFRVFLPAAAGPAQPTELAESVELPRGAGELVLLIDDEAPMRRVLQRILERHGYQVLAAAGGQEALELQAAHAGSIRLVLTDLDMPHPGGEALIRSLRAAQPGLRVVCMSGHGAKVGIEPPPAAFVDKPFEVGTILGVVHQVLTRG